MATVYITFPAGAKIQFARFIAYQRREASNDRGHRDVSARPARNARRQTKTFQATAPKYRGVPGLIRKNYFMSEDGRRAGGIYVWELRADAERMYTPDWSKFVEGKFGTSPVVEYLHSPVMVDNRDGTISVAA